MNRAEQHDIFIKEMMSKQAERGGAVGGHSWKENIEIYGPAILFAEIAAINSRLKKMLWDDPSKHKRGDFDWERLLDLLVDIGNYADFLYQWAENEKDKKEF